MLNEIIFGERLSVTLPGNTDLVLRRVKGHFGVDVAELIDEAASVQRWTGLVRGSAFNVWIDSPRNRFRRSWFRYELAGRVKADGEFSVVAARLRMQPMAYAFLAVASVFAATVCTAVALNNFGAGRYLEAGGAVFGLLVCLAVLVLIAVLGQFIDYADREKLRYFFSSVIARELVESEEAD